MKRTNQQLLPLTIENRNPTQNALYVLQGDQSQLAKTFKCNLTLFKGNTFAKLMGYCWYSFFLGGMRSTNLVEKKGQPNTEEGTKGSCRHLEMAPVDNGQWKLMSEKG